MVQTRIRTRHLGLRLNHSVSNSLKDGNHQDWLLKGPLTSERAMRPRAHPAVLVTFDLLAVLVGSATSTEDSLMLAHG